MAKYVRGRLYTGHYVRVAIKGATSSRIICEQTAHKTVWGLRKIQDFQGA